MPKLIDWGVRFDLMREAVVRLAARGGAGAVTLAAVAAELNVSPSTLRRTLDSPAVLPPMGVAWIARQRRYPRYRGRPKGVVQGSPEHAALLLERELPDGEEALERERAWRELTGRDACAEVIELRDDHDGYLDALARHAVGLVLLGDPPDEREVILLRAVMDGLTAAACRGSITLEQAPEALDHYLVALRGMTSRPVSPDAA